ncbi:MAG: ABC transporter permease subunit, partial [Dietzia sp.]|nr:ABC transporter permease subunit [Dietzia sp.]
MTSGGLKPVLGALLVFGAWQIVGMSGALGPGIAPPTDIVARIFHDGLEFYGIHIVTTVQAAGMGYVVGNLAAILLSILVVAVPRVESLVLQMGIASACVPLIAIAPILSALFSGNSPSAIMAGISVFFITLVATISGLKSSDKTSEDLVSAYGGNKLMIIRKVQLLSGLPRMLAALKIAVPAAFLGAIVGEFMGQPRGLGAALVVAQQASDVTRTWSLAIMA